MIIKNTKIQKELIVENKKLLKNIITNLLTGDIYDMSKGEEFTISYYLNKKDAYRKFRKIAPVLIKSSNMQIVDEKDNTLTYFGSCGNDINLTVKVEYVVKDDVIAKSMHIESSKDMFLDYITMDEIDVDLDKFYWSRPVVKEVITIPSYIAALGQPIYNNTIWTALHTPVGDNYVDGAKTVLKYHIGRNISEFKGGYDTPSSLIGAAIAPTMLAMRDSFFSYVYTFARKPSMYITYNSWYDYMLDINTKIIKDSFTEIHNEFEKSGLRPLDCYVIDDGWCDYWTDAFWKIKEDRFPDGFLAESELTRGFGSHFGLWVGPRGGYTKDTYPYAKHLAKIGYSVSRNSMDICTGDPNYIRDLGERMIYFMKERNVEYFKLDGFAWCQCKNPKHGHPVGNEKNGLYFYTFLWEEWLKVFKKMRKTNPNVFINLTSYAHCSPFFLEYASAIWMNNANDMGYIGEGASIDQCLNYRDGRYYNLQNERQVQLPSQYIYNHEPNYGQRNYNPPLPDPSKKTVIYTDEEFEKYLYSCLMRGSGFIELYYSPSLMKDGNKYAINAKVLKWAEENFEIIANSTYFGGLPVDGKVYGYIGTNGKNAIVSFRNPTDKDMTYTLTLSDYTFMDGEYEIREYYPTQSEKSLGKGDLTVELLPYQVKIFEIQYQ